MPYVTEDNLTDVVLQRWKDIPDPRLRQVMQSLIKHVHGFVREIEPTQAEWALAIDWLTRSTSLSSDRPASLIFFLKVARTADCSGFSVAPPPMIAIVLSSVKSGATTPIPRSCFNRSVSPSTLRP